MGRITGVGVIVVAHNNGVVAGVDQQHLKAAEIPVVNDAGLVTVGAPINKIVGLTVVIFKTVIKVEAGLLAIAQHKGALLVAQAEDFSPDILQFIGVQGRAM